MTPAERARQIDKEEFEAECADVRKRALENAAVKRAAESVQVEKAIGRRINPSKPPKKAPRQKPEKSVRPANPDAKRYSFRGKILTMQEIRVVTGLSTYLINQRRDGDRVMDDAEYAALKAARAEATKQRRKAQS